MNEIRLHRKIALSAVARRLFRGRFPSAVHRRLYAQYLRCRCNVSRRSVRGDLECTVSLTSYGARVGSVHLTIESIARSRARPRRIVLSLGAADARRAAARPLRRLQRRGLEIAIVEDLFCHTKYYSIAVKMSQADGTLTTADDDVIYPVNWLKGLVNAHIKFPADVICYRAKVIALSHTGLAPYSTWPMVNSTSASGRHFATGVSGVLYPISMVSAIQAAGDRFMRVCPKNDDIWLHNVALRSGHMVRQILPTAQDYPTLPGSQRSALMTSNVFAGANDVQLAATYDESDIAVLTLQD